jgi:hypothetical protein
MSWLSDYIGKPWREDAEGPDAYDCKGLVRAVQARVWCRPVPALLNVGRLTDWVAVRASAARDGWRPVATKPVEGDIVVVRGKEGAHVGTFVTVKRRLQVLHAHSCIKAGVQIGRARLTPLPELLMGGYSRPEVWRFAP